MWDWAIWGALAVAVLTGTAALVILVLRSVESWRHVRSVRRTVLRRLDELAAAGSETAEKAAAAGDTAELQASVRRLRTSLDRLKVLRDALAGAGDTLGWVTVVLSGK